MESNFLTARQVAELYFNGTIDYKNVLRLTREGNLPAIKAGKCYIYQIEALNLWTKKNFSTPAFTKLKPV